MKQKLLIILTVISFFNINCVSQKKEYSNKSPSQAGPQKYQIEKIELSEETRGTHRIFTITPTSKTTSVNGTSTTAVMSSTEWENIIKQVQEIDLAKISSLESPTTNRFSDRALSSSILIVTPEKRYQSSQFDAGIPPKELENLYRILIKGNQKPSKKAIR